MRERVCVCDVVVTQDALRRGVRHAVHSFEGRRGAEQLHERRCLETQDALACLVVQLLSWEEDEDSTRREGKRASRAHSETRRQGCRERIVKIVCIINTEGEREREDTHCLERSRGARAQSVTR